MQHRRIFALLLTMNNIYAKLTSAEHATAPMASALGVLLGASMKSPLIYVLVTIAHWCLSLAYRLEPLPVPPLPNASTWELYGTPGGEIRDSSGKRVGEWDG
jgi:hypothetical protein